jgi:bisphosphoglycerate-independent phosphoglycerate mutase (AlkP superfamily)
MKALCLNNKIVFHIFTDGRDEYSIDKDKAYQIYKDWCEEYDNVRLWTMEDDGENLIDLNCCEAKGNFPY